MQAATAKFAELLKSFHDRAKATATIPPGLHFVGSGKDQLGEGPSRVAAAGGMGPCPRQKHRGTGSILHGKTLACRHARLE